MLDVQAVFSSLSSRRLWSLGLIVPVMAVLLLPGRLGERERRPNVVVILIDDLGWADTEVYGSEFYETPHVNELASDGMRFTQAYAASPVCSPSRSALLTGNHPARLNQTNWIPGRENSPENPLLEAEDVDHLPRSEVTVAEALQQNGYVTAHMGKWHLGGEGHLPKDQGFDVNVAGNENGSPPDYFWPYERGDYKLEKLAETGAEGEYLTTRLGREAAEFIRRHADQPFFLHLSHYAVHTPLQAPDSLVEKYETKLDTMSRSARPLMGEEHGHKWLLQQNSPVFAAMVETMDRTVGHVRDALRQAGVDDETVVIFTSDNGGLATDHPSTSNYPLRAGKGWLYEGGVRVPQIVYWPGATKPGSVSETPVFGTDLYRTILEVTGTTVPEGQGLDGKSLVPILRTSGHIERDRFYWHFPHYHGGGNTPSGAMRSDSFKLVQYFGSEEVELYDLASDPREQKDLSGARPVLRDSLLDRLDRWRTQVDARMPEPNPEYRP